MMFIHPKIQQDEQQNSQEQLPHTKHLSMPSTILLHMVGLQDIRFLDSHGKIIWVTSLKEGEKDAQDGMREKNAIHAAINANGADENIDVRAVAVAAAVVDVE